MFKLCFLQVTCMVTCEIFKDDIYQVVLCYKFVGFYFFSLLSILLFLPCNGIFILKSQCTILQP